jgi:hypothetical protein
MDASPVPTLAADVVRQALNVLGAAGQIAATAYLVGSGASDYLSGPAGAEVPIVPAGYAFAIWGPIYAGSLAYAVWQALPRNRARSVFRRAGWGTALAFAATAGWLVVAARPERVWGTVALFVVVAVGLAVAMRAVERDPSELSRAERWLVRAPIAVFSGWTSVAVFANTATALRYSGITRPGGETGLTLLMLAASTALAARVAASTRNAWYAGTVAWAAVAIAVANVVATDRPRNVLVAVASVLGALVVGAAVRGRRRRVTQS